jgi:acetylornithine deacetylase/succinyl-diaminopimelate desuccinylase-like protein
VTELWDLLALPNARGDAANLRRNAAALRDGLIRRGLTADIVETPATPLVIGELRVRGAQRTLLLYAHYDGQPVDPSAWRQPTPFTPVLRRGRLEEGAAEIGDARALTRFEPDWRLYARSASDDKGPIVALLGALDALSAAGAAPTANIKVILDGDEESGSTGLLAVLPQLRERLAADQMIVLDGPAHGSGRPTVTLGVRGILGFELTVYGPKGALHSGHYGNWVPNPAARLVRLLASMKDDSGRVLVPGFYDGIAPLTPEEQALLRAVPDDPDALTSLFGIAGPEPSAESLQDALQRPSFNIRGLSSAYVGAGATNIIPDRAVASIDVRLVAETPSTAILQKIRAHMTAQGFHVVEVDPDDATRARYRDIVRITAPRATEGYRLGASTPEARRVIAALGEAFGQPPVVIRNSGGTLPVAAFSAALDVPVLSVPTVNFDNNQHAENENLRLGHFFTSVRTIAALLTMR